MVPEGQSLQMAFQRFQKERKRQNKNKAQPASKLREVVAKKRDVDPVAENVLLRFKIPDSSVSGLRVDALNLTNENYNPYKGVRSMTRSGNVEIRIPRGAVL